MKSKIVSALLLLICFSFLAILSGAVPVLAEDSAPSFTGPTDAEALPYTPPPDGTSEPDDAPALYDAAADMPEQPAPETPLPAPAAEDDVPDAVGTGVRILSTTITDSELIDNDTYYNVDAAALLEEGHSLTLPAEGYQILIIHTHTTEAYTQDVSDPYEPSGDYRTTDVGRSVARVGEELASALRAYGLNVLHDSALYDYPSYNGSYARSGAAIEEYLAAYPGIRLVIDLHRDAIGSGDTIYKTVTEAEGTQAAQIMFVMGSDVNLEHPDWRENLKLALALQTTVCGRYETLMRPTVLCDYRYNQQLTMGSLLMEVGTAGNSLQEAITAVKLFADAAGPYLVSLIEPA